MEASKSGRINVAVKLLAAGAKPDHQDNVRKNTGFHSEAKYVPAQGDLRPGFVFLAHWDYVGPPRVVSWYV